MTAEECLQPSLEAVMQASSEAITVENIVMSAYYTEKIPRPLVALRKGTSHSVAHSADLTAQIGLAESCDTAVDEAIACYTYVTGDKDLFVQAEETDDIEDL